MAEKRTRPTVTETVHVLDGQKVLVVKADARIVGVQTADVVARRIENLDKIVTNLDERLEKPDVDYLAEAEARIDGSIAGLQKRKAALTADGVATAAKAAIAAKRSALLSQKTALETAASEMAAE